MSVGESSVNKTVASLSSSMAKKRGTLRARGRLASLTVVLVGEGSKFSPQTVQKFAKPGSGSSHLGQRITLTAFPL